jgi:homoserine kinase
MPLTKQVQNSIIAFAPASIANVGPCYDLMGYSLDFIGDFVQVWKTDKAEEIEFEIPIGQYSNNLKSIPPSKNAAYQVASNIWGHFCHSLSPQFGLLVQLHKYMPIGSGMGSSGASCAAAAKAVLTALEYKLTDNGELWNILCTGEEVTAGTPHSDNVIPSYYGKFHFMPREIQNHYSKDIPEFLFSVVVKPTNITVPTADARQAVRDFIQSEYRDPDLSEDEAVSKILELINLQSALSARMLKAVLEQNLQEVGSVLNDNNFLENARKRLIPNFDKVKKAALDAGALGCTIAGAGPSMVAIVNREEMCSIICEAMVEAFSQPCNWLICPPSNKGARIVSDIHKFIEDSKVRHNFWY